MMNGLQQVGGRSTFVISSPSLLLFTDVSQADWGVHLQELIAAGKWSKREADLHIIMLEMKAVLIVLTAFQHCSVGFSHVLIFRQLASNGIFYHLTLTSSSFS